METVPAYVDWQACTAILRSAELADYKVRLKLLPLVMVWGERGSAPLHTVHSSQIPNGFLLCTQSLKPSTYHTVILTSQISMHCTMCRLKPEAE